MLSSIDMGSNAGPFTFQPRISLMQAIDHFFFIDHFQPMRPATIPRQNINTKAKLLFAASIIGWKCSSKNMVYIQVMYVCDDIFQVLTSYSCLHGFKSSNSTLSRVWFIGVQNVELKVTLHLGITSKLNRRLTAQNRLFLTVAIVQNNSNRPEPPVTGGQPPVEF